MNQYQFIEIVRPYTMTSQERMVALYTSLEKLRTDDIEGDIVECGVWKGGNILGIINYLSSFNMVRDIWLYDTFKGMTEANDIDVDYKNNSGKEWLGKCAASLDSVKEILGKTNYPKDRIHYVIGDICETLDNNKNVPNKISLLRLDTDWYTSTKKELEVLYPKLQKNGHLIIDDYGHWQGCKKAVDDFFGDDLDYQKIDYTGIKIIK